MKQKIIIGLSVVLLISAVMLIGHDLFRQQTAGSTSSCCGDDLSEMKKIDQEHLGYFRTKVLETGLKDLSGIAINGNRIYICGNRKVAVWDTNGTETGGFITDSMNSCISVYGNVIYVAAGGSATGFDESGKIKVLLKPDKKKGYITSIAANDKFIFMADAENKRILKYTTRGGLVGEIGKKDSITGAPGFIIPSAYFDVCAGDFDDLWVVNPGRRGIENFTGSGYMRSSWGKPSAEDNGFTGCCNPAHLALLPQGAFVTYEKGIDKVKVFDAAGRFQCYVAGAGSFRGKADFQLGRNNLVKDLATDANGTVYILDAYNRINIFKPKG
jgi:hypothetical protein